MAIVSNEANCLVDFVGETPPIERRLSEGIGAATLFLASDVQGEDPLEHDPQRLYVIGINGVPVPRPGRGVENVAILTDSIDRRREYVRDFRRLTSDNNSKFFGKKLNREDFRYAVLHRALEPPEVERFHDQRPASARVATGYELLKPEQIDPSKKLAVFSRTHIISPYVKMV